MARLSGPPCTPLFRSQAHTRTSPSIGRGVVPTHVDFSADSGAASASRPSSIQCAAAHWLF